MTPQPLEALRRMTYPGRGIILGLDPAGRRLAVAYFVTGRSPSSRARRLVREGGTVWTKPTDADVLSKGNPELLIYPAAIVRGGLAVSNGRQTADVSAGIAPDRAPREILEQALKNWDYEPDAPIFTPRISGCVTAEGRAALSLVSRSADGAAMRRVYEVSLEPGRGALLTTYAGDPASVHPFPGPPREVRIASSSAEGLAEAVDDALAPPPGSPDFRVAVVALTAVPGGLWTDDLKIINRQERTGDHG